MSFLQFYLLGMIVTYLVSQGKDIYDYVMYVKRGGPFPESHLEELKEKVANHMLLALVWPVSILVFSILLLGEVLAWVAVTLAKRVAGK